MSESSKKLRKTAWLADRLGLSLTTVEKLRARQPELLPPCLCFGRSIRYDEAAVEQWLQDQLCVNALTAATHTDDEMSCGTL
ncbi:MAG TPA: helix-turn-helix domain-containing protein, partial [Methylobacter sp.]